MRRDRKHEKDNEMDASSGALLLIAAMLFTQSGIVSLAEETGSVITIASAEDLVLLADSVRQRIFPPERLL